MLMVSPSALNVMIEHRIERGIETAMMIVLRQLPRKIRIMMAVKHAAMIASRTTPLIEARTKSYLTTEQSLADGSIMMDIEVGGSA